MALAADGKIFTWGDAKFGQLGHQQLVALVQVGPSAILRVTNPRVWIAKQARQRVNVLSATCKRPHLIALSCWLWLLSTA
jgi:hypothetical protein